MKNKNLIVLVGMPGSGKTSLASALAKRLNLTFADLDVLLVAEEGMSIPAIFEEKGEDYFRKREAALLKKVLEQNEPMVLATGGGAPCFFNNMELIRQHAKSIYLEVSWTLLAHRLASQPGQRPLLQDISEEEFVGSLEEKFGWRISFYQQADVQLKVEEEQSPDDLANVLLAKLRK